MTTEQKIIEKQRELVKHLRLFAITNTLAPFTKQWNDARKELESELSALEKELAEQKEEPKDNCCTVCANYDNDSICNKCDDSYCMFEQKSKPALSAEEILNKLEGHEGLSLNDSKLRLNRMQVILAMKQYRQAGIRESLINYTLWTYKDYKYKELQRPEIEKIVDEYLNQSK